jgi:transcriptional regulator with XRE-family HTH domain
MPIRKKPELNFLEISFIKKTVSVRKAFGLSQEQVAKEAGVSTGFIAQFESFHHRPTENVVKKIAKGLSYQGLVEEFNKIKEEEKKSGNSNFFIVLPLVKQLIKKQAYIRLFTWTYFISQYA